MDLNKKMVTSNRELNINDECMQTLQEISFINDSFGKKETFENEIRRQTLPPAEIYSTMHPSLKEKLQ